MEKLLHNIRFYVLCFSFLLGVSLYLYVSSIVTSERLLIIRLTQYFSLMAVSFLYLALVVGPLSRFIDYAFIQHWLKARRALGVSAFFFGLLHGSIAFFLQLGGFEGLFFLNDRYLLAISLSSFALLVLSLMAGTSFDWVIAKMKFKRWKALHRLVYIAGVSVLIHAVMLGSHFQVLSSTIPIIVFTAVSVLLLMHAVLWERRIKSWSIFKPSFGLITLLTIVFLGFLFVRYVNPMGADPNASSSFSVHTQHIQLAEQAQQPTRQNSNIPGLQGDPTKRYSVTFNHSEDPQKVKDVNLLFKINDASNGNPVILFDTLYEKTMHLIVVNENLTYFSHIHPEFSTEGFKITTQFPEDGFYRLYTDFQPKGAIEQQFAHVLKVGEIESPTTVPQFIESYEKEVDGYKVTLKKNNEFQSNLLSVGRQMMTFRIEDITGNPTTDLYPYLASFGHLVLINEETKDYVHVHPANLTPPQPQDRSGPEIQFLPLGLYGQIKPGNYRVFLQLNPKGELKTFDFSIKVKP